MGSFLRVVADNTSPEGARAKTLPLRDPDAHGMNDVASDAGRQHDRDEQLTARRLFSKVREVGRALGLSILMRALAVFESQSDLAATLDVQKKHLQEMLAGARPWPIEAFVLIAQRRPDAGEEVIVAYADLLPPDRIDAAADRLRALAEQKRQEDV